MVRYRISIHARSGAPEDALGRLADRLGERRAGVAFMATATGINATSREEAPSGMDEGTHTELGRRKVWEIVRDVCAGHDDLEGEWYAVSPRD